jgi:Flp pilus assembly CpaF family ATPase
MTPRSQHGRWPAPAVSPADPALVERLRREVADRLDARVRADEAAGRTRMGLADQRQLGRELISRAVEAETRAALAAGRAAPAPAAEDATAQAIHDALFGLGRLQRLLDDPEIENINANGADRVFVRYADGRRARVDPIAGSDAELVELLRLAAARLGLGERRFDLGAPRLSVQLPDGSRLFAVMAVAARPSLSIRRHRYPRLTLGDLARLGTVDTVLHAFLAAAVRARKNLLVCGDTGAGKTTLLRALAAEIGPAERLVTVEDSLELGLDRFPDVHPDVVALEAREPNVEGEGEVTQAELVRWALRMSPDRVLVGEVRGEEVLPMLNAMSQGNDGSMCTLHASSSQGAFAKLATYAIQAPERLPLEATNLLVASAVHFIVVLAHDRVTGRRVAASVREVTGADGPVVLSNEVFRPGPGRQAVPGAPLRAETLDQLMDAGLDPGLLDPSETWWDASQAAGGGQPVPPGQGWAG